MLNKYDRKYVYFLKNRSRSQNQANLDLIFKSLLVCFSGQASIYFFSFQVMSVIYMYVGPTVTLILKHRYSVM